jgi:hypothetical protein
LTFVQDFSPKREMRIFEDMVFSTFCSFG